MTISMQRVTSIGILFLILGSAPGYSASPEPDKNSKPNFIIVLTDDQGYNDLGCFGSETIKTPRIDRMAEEGMTFTSFYAQPVCGPSRGALMTGRYPLRIGGGWTVNGEETMLPEILKSQGYTTACIGKWDMSGRKFTEGQLPNDQGFDYYFGTIGANDRGFVQLVRNRDSLYRTDDMSMLTKLYTDEALAFIEKQKDSPFFLYLAHTMPHVQIDASSRFKGKSDKELYGDVIEEIDWNTGRILDLLKALKLDTKTFVIYFSDNGPWAQKEAFYRNRHGGQLATGSAAPLRGTKGSAWEGGFRVPCIMWAPERISAGTTTDEMASSLDILPTFTKLAGARIPEDLLLDGFDLSSLILSKTEKSPREIFHYHQRGGLRAVRLGQWKLMLPQGPAQSGPELFNLKNDVAESTNVADENPQIVKKLLELAQNAPNDPEPPRR